MIQFYSTIVEHSFVSEVKLNEANLHIKENGNINFEIGLNPRSNGISFSELIFSLLIKIYLN